MAVFAQFRLLLWKNLLIQRRQPLWTVFELVVPILLSAVLVGLRQIVVATPTPVTHYFPFPVTGTLAYDAQANLTTNPTNGTGRFSVYSLQDCFFPTFTAFAPDTSVTRSIMDAYNKRLGCVTLYLQIGNNTFPYPLCAEVTGFDDEDQMQDFLLNYFTNHSNADSTNFCGVNLTNPFAPPTWNQYFGGITFDTDFAHTGLGSPSYRIRLSNTARHATTGNTKQGQFVSAIDSSWDTQLAFPLVEQNRGPRSKDSVTGGPPGYYNEGFLTIQRALDMAIIETLHPEAREFLDNMTIEMKRYPYPEYLDNPFIAVIQNDLPIILMLSMCLSVLYIIRNVVMEKEARLKEYMRTMGLSSWIHWVTYFVNSFMLLLIAISLITMFLCLSFNGKRIIDKSDPSIIFVFLLLYAISTICFSFCVSVFFKKGNTAAGAGFVVWFVLYLPFVFLSPRYGSLSRNTKLASCLLLNTGVALGAYVIGVFEGEDTGVQWSTISQPGTFDDNLSMLDVLVIMVFDTFLCIVITWYVEKVYPGDQGVPLPFYFPFMPSYWCGQRTGSVDSEFNGAVGGSRQPISDKFEPEPLGKSAEIVVHGLRKEFGRGKDKKVAVNGISMKMYPGQITALLGHNGAGKSTTMAMLTGLLPPSAGYATIRGMDTRSNLTGIRRVLGLCPQYNTLFDNLTVDEHLEFFCKLKGRLLLASERDHLLRNLGLQDKRQNLAKTLSGGMKRKLCVAIALIGGTEVVMLDEPTSGMDPGARHDAWHLLQQEKAKRTLLLTTHYMEEADLLGDRIAIMSHGELQCNGSGIFLKNRYGAGYHLTVVFDGMDNVQNGRQYDPTKGQGTAVQTQQKALKVQDVVQKHCPSAQLQSTVGTEATFLLPHEDRNKFEAMFAELELQQKQLGANFGVSITTMEEVFLKVGQIADEKFYRGPGHEGQAPPELSADLARLTFGTAESERNTGMALILQRYYAMIVKRVRHSMRNYRMLISQLVVPVFCVLMALIINNTLPQAKASPKLDLNLSKFGQNHVLGFRANSTDLLIDNITQSYVTAVRVNLTDSQVDMLPNGTLEAVDQDLLDLMNDPQIGMKTFNLQYMISALFARNNDSSYNFTALFNNQALHTPAIALNALSNAILSYFSNGTKFIHAANAPLPPTSVDKLNDWLAAGVQEFNLAFNICFGMAFLMSSFAVFLVKERITNSKHLQLLGGVGPKMFWASTFTWDVVNYIVPASIILILLKAFNVHYLVDGIRGAHMLLLLLLYGWAVIPQTYCGSFLFNGAAGAFVKIVIFNILTGLVPLMVITVLILLQENDVVTALDWTFMSIFPNYCLGQSIDLYYINQYFVEMCGKMPEQLCDAYNSLVKDNQNISNAVAICCAQNGHTDDALQWKSPGIGRMCFFLGIQGIGYFILLFCIEYGLIRRVRYFLTSLRSRGSSAKDRAYSMQESSSSGYSEDEDVRNERENLARLAQGASSASLNSRSPLVADRAYDYVPAQAAAQPVIIVRNLSKFYEHFCAVNQLNFSVQKADCFGLLGANGAGKTSTFQMLTGAHPVTDGDAYIASNSIRRDWRKAGSHMGYCPQFDALIDVMTGREMLHLFARLRGVPEAKIDMIATNIMRAFGLMEYADRQVQTYSGGNQRKLSLGVALIGLPPVLLLDEPTSGVDPGARRLIWHVLSHIRERGVAVVLSSHSMEECEALCTKIAIMAHGRLVCLGTQQHLKTKFGNAYTVLLKVASAEQVQVVTRQMSREFPSSILKDVHQQQLNYLIPIESVRWSQLFGTVYRLAGKPELGIVDYLVSQTSLEQVFLTLTHQTTGVGGGDSPQANLAYL